MPKKVVLDIDDWSVSCPNFELLLSLKEHFPKLKVTLFTVPFDVGMASGKVKMDEYMRWAEMVKSYSDWIEIAVHGFMHDKQEMMGDYKKSKETIMAAEKMFTRVKFQEKRWLIGKIWKKYHPDILYKKIFKAAGWQMNDAAYEAARDMGYVVAVDRNQPSPVIDGLQTYKYNWSINEKFPEDYSVVKGHGHMYATPAVNNDIASCYMHLLDQLPSDAEFLTISEHLEYERTKGTPTNPTVNAK